LAAQHHDGAHPIIHHPTKANLPMKSSMKTHHLLCGLLSGLLLLATGNTEAQAGVVVTNPTSLTNGETYRLVFVTSTTRDATSSNIADYNSFVTAVANSNAALFSLGTTWTAVASTVAVSALANTGTDWMPAGIQGVPIFRLDNTLLATCPLSTSRRMPTSIRGPAH
jgi:hypothetical protein